MEIVIRCNKNKILVGDSTMDNTIEKQTPTLALKFERLSPFASCPTKQYDGDAGIDIYSSETVTIPAGKTIPISTGIAIELSHSNFWLQLETRSSMAMKGIFVIGGIIDWGYRGEIRVPIINMSGEDCHINIGDRIAQWIVRCNYPIDIKEVIEIGSSERGSKGFGSSGR